MVTHNVEFAIENISRTILMANGEIIADGPTRHILTNNKLIEKTSLILPQVRMLNIALNSIGIKCPEEIYLKSELSEFLISYLAKNKGESF